MKLKLITSALALTLSTSVFALVAPSQTITVNATVQGAANIENVPATVAFGNLTPDSVQAGTVAPQTSPNVKIYNNDPTKAIQLTSSCSGSVGSQGCYICTGAGCASAENRIPLTCTYKSCGSGTNYVVTPGATDPSASFLVPQSIPQTDGNQAVCATTPGTFTCQLPATNVYPSLGTFTGTLTLNASNI